MLKVFEILIVVVAIANANPMQHYKIVSATNSINAEKIIPRQSIVAYVPNKFRDESASAPARPPIIRPITTVVRPRPGSVIGGTAGNILSTVLENTAPFFPFQIPTIDLNASQDSLYNQLYNVIGLRNLRRRQLKQKSISYIVTQPNGQLLLVQSDDNDEGDEDGEEEEEEELGDRVSQALGQLMGQLVTAITKQLADRISIIGVLLP